MSLKREMFDKAGWWNGTSSLKVELYPLLVSKSWRLQNDPEEYRCGIFVQASSDFQSNLLFPYKEKGEHTWHPFKLQHCLVIITVFFNCTECRQINLVLYTQWTRCFVLAAVIWNYMLHKYMLSTLLIKYSLTM
jgi:hypothetical protein